MEHSSTFQSQQAADARKALLDRRRFLVSASAGLALWSAPGRAARAMGAAAPLRFQIHPDRHIAAVPQNVMGLSYESTQLGDPEYFSPSNHALIRICQTLSPHGSLRLGGHTSEYTWFKSSATAKEPAFTPVSPAEPQSLTPITLEALHNLRGFLDATGWMCIYGLNLGTGTPERAAEEAAAVMEILGPKLSFLQIGNEPNNYVRAHVRPPNWNQVSFLAEWLRFARAIVKRMPAARLGGPDMLADPAWFELFAREAVAEMKQHLIEITDHFYAEGPPASPEATMQTLLFNSKKIDREIAETVRAAHVAKLPCRMSEVNSCYSGGKPGVSNTLGSALWAGDLTLKLVSSGYSGINFHGGNAKEISASVGGKLLGDAVAGNHASDSYYSPIAGSAAEGYTARPIFYGMLLASRLAGATLVDGSFSATQTAVTAYAALRSDERSLQVAVFNKSSEPADVLLSPGRSYRSAAATHLTGPALDATDDVRLGNALVEGNGSWSPAAPEALHRTASGEFKLTLPAASAALVLITPV